MARSKGSVPQEAPNRQTRSATKTATNPAAPVARKSYPRAINTMAAVDVYREDVKPPVRKKKSQVEGTRIYISAAPQEPIGTVVEDTLSRATHLCRICSAPFFDEEARNDHEQCHPKNKLQCQHCFRKFNSKAQLGRHSLECNQLTDDEPVVEPTEESQASTSSNDGDGRARRYVCKNCKKTFFTPSHLTIHMRVHTGERPFVCDQCPKTFSNNGARTKHYRIHTGERPFKCDVCSLGFALKGTLNRHLKTHTGEKPHKCPHCPSTFIQSGGLKAHLFFHTGKNGFACDMCDKQFNRKARLQMHKAYVHEKIRPYVCNTCSKGFARKEDLNRHVLLHTGVRSHRCTICHKDFAIKTSLRLHMLTHMKEDPQACNVCGRNFIRKDCLSRHIRKLHREQSEELLLQHGLARDYDNLSIERREKISEDDLVNGILPDDALYRGVREVLELLVDAEVLKNFGWPTASNEFLLDLLIRQCEHEPVTSQDYSLPERLRENVKLLFTGIIEDESLKVMLNNKTIDEVMVIVVNTFS